jgi:hypothetical protein
MAIMIRRVFVASALRMARRMYSDEMGWMGALTVIRRMEAPQKEGTRTRRERARIILRTATSL